MIFNDLLISTILPICKENIKFFFAIYGLDIIYRL